MLSEQQLTAIRKFFSRQPDVIAAYLFGSQATGRSGRAESQRDVDVAVLFQDAVSQSRRFDRTLEFMSDLAAIVRRNVDVVDLNSAPNLLRMNAIMGKLICSANNPIRCGFEVETMGEYHDREYFDRIDRTIRYQQIQQLHYGFNHL